ncbi:histidinol-phosphatase [Rhizobium sp. VS19-DR104.2]|uniref:histidinol-phosphatase n=1 Tax=unclassified Rhizobium TaxID=2613769 RepID=UPI001C5AEB17|nr:MULTISPECIES: histidinol-phosphatase [unclassified Rhizobium]MBZ5762471.1 histidinol-phosphatase [Rhizobium sp. VS19-DR96]MBZ5768514.1 histidinol-phosphatase [Rhizobium sp. VS19-DR129.2]MBZ5776032.1 histidinol-phosphatase [Rhizobium sp. VS19-DRK62.2]MBZ5787196.1 histidinol-phosphatase [Rhizobium sp. VS19-DR121]MBZ5804549.1 histidinol-phosphatase [Rhizobium sp. VS19-DR181]
MNYPDELFFHRLADAADRETMSRFRTSLATSSKLKEGFSFDPVTEADREAERVIRAAIQDQFPDQAILGEEFGATGSGPIQWVLDPIDGTRPFLLGLPVWGTLIGLYEEGRAIMGMMSQPVTKERFWADRSGSFLLAGGSRHQLRTRSTTDLTDAVLHTTSPEDVTRHPGFRFSALSQAVKMTRYGGECYAFAMLAAGQIDICVEFSVQAYDVAAMIPIIEGAGGECCTLDGGRPEQGGAVIAAGNKHLLKKALEILLQ